MAEASSESSRPIKVVEEIPPAKPFLWFWLFGGLTLAGLIYLATKR